MGHALVCRTVMNLTPLVKVRWAILARTSSCGSHARSLTSQLFDGTVMREHLVRLPLPSVPIGILTCNFQKKMMPPLNRINLLDLEKKLEHFPMSQHPTTTTLKLVPRMFGHSPNS